MYHYGTKNVRKTKVYLDQQLSPENPYVSDVVKNFVRDNLNIIYNPTATYGQPVPNIHILLTLLQASLLYQGTCVWQVFIYFLF